MKRLILVTKKGNEYLLPRRWGFYLSLRVWKKNTLRIETGPAHGWMTVGWNSHYFSLRKALKSALRR